MPEYTWIVTAMKLNCKLFDLVNGSMKINLIKVLSLLLAAFTVFSVFTVAGESSSPLTADTVFPDSLDLSETVYFPEIESQGSQGSCACWAQVYYQFTYEMNRSMGVETTAENSFSPTWIYNFANGGRGEGTWDKDIYLLMKEIGNLPLSVLPYITEDYNNWYPQESYWKTAMKYRISDYHVFNNIGNDDSQITSPDDSDLDYIKSLLLGGNVVAASTYVVSWNTAKIKSDSALAENEKYVGQEIVTRCTGTRTRHRVVIVGYDDNIWADVNENGVVDSGEIGAFKVANSWGKNRHNEGFVWVAYDALNKTSSVTDCPTVNYRPPAFHDYTTIEVLPYDSDAQIFLRYTLNTCDRSQATVTVTAQKGDEVYTYDVGPKLIHGMYSNKFSYDGTNDSNDGTMVYALSNIVPSLSSENLHEYSWSVKFEDTTADGKAFTVKDVEIVDEATNRICKPEQVFPFSLDGSSRTVEYPEISPWEPTEPTTASTCITEASEPTETQVPTSSSTAVCEPSETGGLVTDATSTTDSGETEPVETQNSSYNTTEAEKSTIASTNSNETQETTTEKTAVSVLIGDANESGAISISDATLIQKYLAFIINDSELNLKASDCNDDGKVSVKDVTCIQKYLAKLSGCGRVGESITLDEEVTLATLPYQSTTAFINDNTTAPVYSSVAVSTVTEPAEITTVAFVHASSTVETESSAVTVAPETTTASVPVSSSASLPQESTSAYQPTDAVENTTQTKTEPPVTENTVIFTDSFNWGGTVYCYYWSDSNQTMTAWPGQPMQSIGSNGYGQTLYFAELPDGVEYVIFSNGSIQTVDIPFDGGSIKYYPVSLDNNGKYTVNTWQ